jgi:hypothetical protein
MNEPSSLEGGAETPSGRGTPRSLIATIRAGMTILGALAMVFAAVFWILDETGTPTPVPYLLIGIAGLIIYNLARLPDYLKLMLPGKEEPGEKFHRK